MTSKNGTFDGAEAVDTEAPSGGGLLERAYRRFVAAREARVRAAVYAHLSRLGEHQLIELGYEPAEIRRIRSHGTLPAAYWI